MPIYQYECEGCSTRFEVRRSFDDGSEAECPKCGGKGRRLFSPVSVIFCGPGFYSTDSRDNGSERADGKEASAAAERAGKA